MDRLSTSSHTRVTNCKKLSVFGPHFSFYRAMRCISAVFAVMQCPSVCSSVTFVDHVKTNKHIFEIFSPSGSDTILVFPYQRGADIPTGTPLTGASNARGYDKMTIFFTNISLYLRNGYSQMGTCSETICKHRILNPSIQHLA